MKKLQMQMSEEHSLWSNFSRSCLFCTHL